MAQARCSDETMCAQQVKGGASQLAFMQEV
jgi:hypothetical protein